MKKKSNERPATFEELFQCLGELERSGFLRADKKTLSLVQDCREEALRSIRIIEGERGLPPGSILQIEGGADSFFVHVISPASGMVSHVSREAIPTFLKREREQLRDSVGDF